MRVSRVLAAGAFLAGVGVCTPNVHAAEVEVAGGTPSPAAAEAEPAITVPGVEGDYLRAMHTRIHWRWSHNFIDGVAKARPPKDPINNPALTAEVLFTVRWDGSPAEVTLSKPSGVKEFDQAALAAVRGDIPFPVPPLATYGDDGVAHFSWVFARDHRLCSQAELRRREDPLEEALPRLFIQGRLKEALLRVTRSMEAGNANAMSIFARSWLARPLADRAANVSAAAALARVGDRRQIDRLRPGLARPDTAIVAAQGLAALKVDLCAMVDQTLRARDEASFDLALAVLREERSLAASSPCLTTLASIVDDEAAPKPIRASALRAFGALDPAGAHKRVVALLADRAPELRAAAATAIAKPGGGRPMLYRLEPMLKDPSNEVRAAVAAAILKSCGDLAFDYVRPLFKNNDERPIASMIEPLAELPSAGAMDLMEKILKRSTPDMRTRIIRSLAFRKDERARTLVKPMIEAAKESPYTAHDLKVFLYSASSVEELMPLAKDPHLGILAYKAMLRAGRHKDAAAWLVSQFDRVSPEVLGDAFGAWLANPPTKLASVQ